MVGKEGQRNMNWISNTDNTALVVSIISLILSLSNWLYSFYTQRKNLHFKIHEAKSKDGVTFLFMQIENLSRLPIAITRICLIADGQHIDCTVNPKLIYENTRKSGKEVIERRFVYSLQIPIEIPSLGAVSGYILFEDSQCGLSPNAKRANFQICTNRGKALEIELSLPADWCSKP